MSSKKKNQKKTQKPLTKSELLIEALGRTSDKEEIDEFKELADLLEEHNKRVRMKRKSDNNEK
jgi:hypothetical protein